MDTQSVPEHKHWAIDLTQEQFFHEFVRRNPNSDAIPLRAEWLGMPVAAPPRGMDPFNPEDMVANDTPRRKSASNPSTEGYGCRGHGCGRTFTHSIGRISHERRCAHALNTKAPGKVVDGKNVVPQLN